MFAKVAKGRFLERQLSLAFLLIGLIVMAVALVGWSGNARLSHHITVLGEQVIENTIALNAINQGRIQILAAERALINPILSPALKSREQTTIDESWQLIDQGITNYQINRQTNYQTNQTNQTNQSDQTDRQSNRQTDSPEAQDSDEAKRLATLKQSLEQWRNTHKALLTSLNAQQQDAELLNPSALQKLLSDANNPAQRQAVTKTARKLSELIDINQLRINQEEPAYQAVDMALKALLDANKTNSQQINRTAHQDVQQTRWWVSLGFLLGPLTSLGFAVYFSRVVTRPLGRKIAQVVEIAHRISQGDLTTQIRLDQSQDQSEVGQLYQAFHTMSHDLNTLIREVQEAGLQVTQAVTQISASGRQLEATFSEQVTSTSEISATARDIAARSTQLRDAITEVKGKSQETAISAGDSQKELGRMESTMRQLADATGGISNRLGIISEKANNINSVITTITKVADQTNLLSLNAAIEAEKAGEYGRGFAVVSREIRRLADQTAVATLDIEHMVKEMQSAVTSGVMEMDKFTKDVTKGVEGIQIIGSSLAQTIRQVKNLTPQFVKVSQGVDDQSLGAQQISEAMAQINEASVQTSDSLQEINQVLDNLHNAAQQLRQQISRFHVGEK
jgi:methyl-accepting chemotaxis protein WspA